MHDKILANEVAAFRGDFLQATSVAMDGDSRAYRDVLEACRWQKYRRGRSHILH
jgi:hypothetical protein